MGCCRHKAIIVAIVLSAPALGCASNNQNAAQDSVGPPTSVGRDMSGVNGQVSGMGVIGDPVDPEYSALTFKGLLRSKFGPAPNDLAAIFVTSQNAISACMTEQGFDRPPFPVPDYQASNPYYLTYSLDWVSEHGFVPPINPKFEVSDAERQVIQAAKDDPAFEEALSGGDTPLDGCNARANIEIFGRPDIFEELYELDNRDAEIQTRTLSHPDVIRAQNGWAVCMSTHGFPFGTLDELYSTMWADPRPSPEERVTAIANWNCLTESKYRETLSAIYISGIQEYIGKHESELFALRDVLNAEVTATE